MITIVLDSNGRVVLEGVVDYEVFKAQVLRLSGIDSVDCRQAFDESGLLIKRCIAEAFGNSTPAYSISEPQWGIDSQLASALVTDRNQRVYNMEFDSDPFGGGSVTEGSITLTRCLNAQLAGQLDRPEYPIFTCGDNYEIITDENNVLLIDNQLQLVIDGDVDSEVFRTQVRLLSGAGGVACGEFEADSPATAANTCIEEAFVNSTPAYAIYQQQAEDSVTSIGLVIDSNKRVFRLYWGSDPWVGGISTNGKIVVRECRSPRINTFSYDGSYPVHSGFACSG